MKSLLTVSFLPSTAVMIFSAAGNMFYLNRQNTIRAAERAEIERSGAPVVEDEAEVRRLGDRHRDFVYTL